MGFSGRVYWILTEAGDEHHSRAHGAFMRTNGPQQTREGCRAHWAPEFCGWPQTPSDPTPARRLFLCVLAKALYFSVSLPQKWHCPNTGSCPVAQLYFWPELLSAWPVAPMAWILTFAAFTLRNHVSQGWGLGG